MSDPNTPQWPSVTSDERIFAVFAHIGTIISSFLIPLIIWLIKKDDSSFIDHHGKEALNFQITIFLGYIAGAILAVIGIGILIIFACWILSLVCVIMAAIKANEGKAYRYPVSWRIIQ